MSNIVDTIKKFVARVLGKGDVDSIVGPLNKMVADLKVFHERELRFAEAAKAAADKALAKAQLNQAASQQAIAAAEKIAALFAPEAVPVIEAAKPVIGAAIVTAGALGATVGVLAAGLGGEDAPNTAGDALGLPAAAETVEVIVPVTPTADGVSSIVIQGVTDPK